MSTPQKKTKIKPVPSKPPTGNQPPKPKVNKKRADEVEREPTTEGSY